MPDNGHRAAERSDRRARVERRLVPFIEARASRLLPAGEGAAAVEAIAGYKSGLQRGREGADALAPLPATFWLDTLREFHQRRAEQRRRGPGAPGDPGVPGRTNWIPIGPSVSRRGQVGGSPPVSGRVARIAVAPGGSTVYVASALGGVWRSDDGGATWGTNEDSFDVDPTTFGATSLCCGAIAIDPNAPNRVYVGTGEGDVSDIFAFRFLNYLPSYRGIGPLRSDDGGGSWHTEPVTAGSPTLAGQSFYALAVDPNDRENVVGATTGGLYQRVPDGSGGYQWTQREAANFTSVVATNSGATTKFFAAQWGGGVLSSPDGSTWTPVGTGFPTAGISRVSLAVRGTDASVLYALVVDNGTGHVDLYRLDGGAGTWHPVTLTPVIFNEGNYTLGLAVDPNDANTVYMSTTSLARGTVTPSGGAYACATTDIGNEVHADVHFVGHTPNVSGALWVGTDGGVFFSTNPTAASPTFVPRNTGLATLATSYFDQHPSQPAVIFCGTQDNATQRYTGEEAWLRVAAGDGGCCLVNWTDPYQVITFQDGGMPRTTDGGATFPADVGPPGYTWTSGVMAPPMAIAPQSGVPTDSQVVALGADRPYYSTTFGNAWTSLPTGTSSDALPHDIFALAFVNPNKLHAATTAGEVYRYDHGGAGWTRTRVDNVSPGGLPLANIITRIAVDPADASGNSIYVTFGGSGDYRHVWHFDGTTWTPRSGPGAGAATALLDAEYNAIAVDPTTSPPTLYAGGDVGVWKSTDSGANWSIYSDGLPDAAVLDLRLHQPSRLLRASLHGRGLFEIKIDPPAPLDTEIYIRDTDLDTGRSGTVDYLPDPENQGHTVVHWESPNIKVDVPTPAGWQTPSPSIDFFQFVDTIQDGSGGVATLDPASGTVTNRVYVEVHNRGIVPASTVNVMLLLTDASPGLPTLPSGYTANVEAGTAVGGGFTLVGVQTISNLRVGIPQVAEFPLPSTMLPPPASLPGDSHYCLLALAHSPTQDDFTATQTNVDLLTTGERKVAQKNLHIVGFVGIPPAGGSPHGWGAFQLHGGHEGIRLADLILDTRGYRGRVALAIPKSLPMRNGLGKSLVNLRADGEHSDVVEDWRERHTRDLRWLAEHGRFDYHKVRHMAEALEYVAGQPLLHAEPGSIAEVHALELHPKTSTTAFLRIEPPRGAKVGDSFEFRLMQRDHGKHEVIGGCTYRVQILAPSR